FPPNSKGNRRTVAQTLAPADARHEAAFAELELSRLALKIPSPHALNPLSISKEDIVHVALGANGSIAEGIACVPTMQKSGRRIGASSHSLHLWIVDRAAKCRDERRHLWFGLKTESVRTKVIHVERNAWSARRPVTALAIGFRWRILEAEIHTG